MKVPLRFLAVLSVADETCGSRKRSHSSLLEPVGRRRNLADALVCTRNVAQGTQIVFFFEAIGWKRAFFARAREGLRFLRRDYRLQEELAIPENWLIPFLVGGSQEEPVASCSGRAPLLVSLKDFGSRRSYGVWPRVSEGVCFCLTGA